MLMQHMHPSIPTKSFAFFSVGFNGINSNPIMYFKIKQPIVMLKISETNGAYQGLIKNDNNKADANVNSELYVEIKYITGISIL